MDTASVVPAEEGEPSEQTWNSSQVFEMAVDVARQMDLGEESSEEFRTGVLFTLGLMGLGDELESLIEITGYTKKWIEVRRKRWRDQGVVPSNPVIMGELLSEEATVLLSASVVLVGMGSVLRTEKDGVSWFQGIRVGMVGEVESLGDRDLIMDKAMTWLATKGSLRGFLYYSKADWLVFREIWDRWLTAGLVREGEPGWATRTSTWSMKRAIEEAGSA